MSKRAATDMSSSSSAPPSPSPPPQPRAADADADTANADAAPAFPHLDALPAPPFPLTLNERRLFETILATCAHQRLRTTVRCAGGWVRDKLLGRTSHDVDLAVDGDMTGAQFADLLVAHVAQHCPGVRASGVGVIRKNPDQSKHLETATFVLHGLAVDCVALRSETYTDSRIPQTAAGTAEQDAQRRDFTFNALFLNLATMRVEDLCGTGRADLAAGLLRTPLPAAQTFADDPLRVLRAVRFAARLGFRMDDELRAAAADPAGTAAWSDA
jgi:tRNA nucleotidyltransferase/poly(A) polymerase